MIDTDWEVWEAWEDGWEEWEWWDPPCEECWWKGEKRCICAVPVPDVEHD